MGLSQRHTALVYTWSGSKRSWTPGWVWSLLQWLGNLLPVVWLLLRLGLTPPEHVLSDEKFATLEGDPIYLFLVSQGELIWHAQWLQQANEEAFEPAITNFLTRIHQEPQRQKQLPPAPHYEPQTATTDGWKAVQNAWKSVVPQINLLECRWHGSKRISATLKDYAQQHPELTQKQLQTLKQQFGHLFAAPSLAAYSQRLRRLSETYANDPILSKRLNILEDKQLLFTAYLDFPQASPFLAPLDRSMRFQGREATNRGSVLGTGEGQRDAQCLGHYQQPPHISARCQTSRNVAGRSVWGVIEKYPLDGSAKFMYSGAIVGFGSSIGVR